MSTFNLPIEIKGHVKIEDDLGEVLLDQDNAVHPQNLSRVIARALSNEGNFIIHRIAFGNGGTEIDAAFTITFKTPNDGQPPDTQTWESRLYNETYSEIVDDSNTNIGVDPGSAGPRVGTRAGGGARPENDPATVANVSGPGVRSRELGLTSEIVIVSVLNPTEPAGQISDNSNSVNSFDSSFTFDEIGLFTSGLQANNSSGVMDVDVNDKTSIDVTELLGNTYYHFNVVVDNGTLQTISFAPPADNPTYGELVEALNDPAKNLNWRISPILGGVKVAITDTTFGTYPSIAGLQTFGFLRFTSKTSGSLSNVTLSAGTPGTGDITAPYDLFSRLPGILGDVVIGTDKGVQNLATDFVKEQERLLTHLVFSPVLKASNRTLTITYTLTVSVARTQQ